MQNRRPTTDNSQLLPQNAVAATNTQTHRKHMQQTDNTHMQIA